MRVRVTAAISITERLLCNFLMSSENRYSANIKFFAIKSKIINLVCVKEDRLFDELVILFFSHEHFS